ncbi:lysophospholipid acyltransferase family protein [Metaclostridioides mangenotii]|uniref:lysophospholipid acyltransferase family protein n=1 Tax=Metaclostridioides mangenotii TaxID=1540 RepID=UPI0004891E40|nr:lysophospholipid acyltransferase family protein [Clostridioides mangenotii]
MNFYKFAIYLFRGFCKVFFRYEIIGAENIPKEGNLVIASNHKSNFDPVFLAASILNREIAAVAKKELFDIKILGFILKKLNVIPINRDKPDVSTVKNILKAVKNGYVLGIFPEGKRIKGDEFGDAKAGLALFAIKSKADVVPVSIISNYKIFRKAVVYMGEPISLEQYYGKKLSNEEYEKISQDILDVIKDNYFKYSK